MEPAPRARFEAMSHASPAAVIAPSPAAPFFSVIIPLEFHRGQAVECLRSWARQTFARERFEIIVACPPGFPLRELTLIRSMLAGHDRLLQLPHRHDMALCADAAQEARGQILFFTESHCAPEPDTLARSEAALLAHPAWAGFSCRSVPVTHNLRSEIEAELYERDIQDAMLRHRWRKVLDQCFVVRREPYFRSGGFEARFGHFAEWLLAARLHRQGCELGYLPEARVTHHYLGKWRGWQEFTEDFAEGEMLFQAQEINDPCHAMFAEVPEWTERHESRRSVARQMTRMLLVDLLQVSRKARGMDELWEAWRGWCWSELASWAWRSLAGSWSMRLPAFARMTWLRMCMEWHLARGNKEHALGAMLECCRSIAVRARARCLRRLASAGARLPAAPASESAWNPAGASPIVNAGFHLLEGATGDGFRWSRPAAGLLLPLDAGKHLLTLQWNALTRRGSEARIRFYAGGRPVPRENVSHRTDSVVVRFVAPARGPLFFGWVCEPLHAPGDARRLGLGVGSVKWIRTGGGSRSRMPVAR